MVAAARAPLPPHIAAARQMQAARTAAQAGLPKPGAPAPNAKAKSASQAVSPKVRADIQRLQGSLKGLDAATRNQLTNALKAQVASGKLKPADLKHMVQQIVQFQSNMQKTNPSAAYGPPLPSGLAANHPNDPSRLMHASAVPGMDPGLFGKAPLAMGSAGALPMPGGGMNVPRPMPTPGNPGGGAALGEVALALLGRVAGLVLLPLTLTGDSPRPAPLPSSPAPKPPLKITPGTGGIAAAGALAGAGMLAHPPVQQGPHVSPLHPAGGGTGTSAPATKPQLPGLEGMVPTAGKLPGNAGMPSKLPFVAPTAYNSFATSLSSKEQAAWKAQIKAAPNAAAAQDVRYQRYLAGFAADKTKAGKAPMARSQWDVAAPQMNRNHQQGYGWEGVPLGRLGIENNNYDVDSAGNPRTVTRATYIDPKTGKPVSVRPDGVSSDVWIDVKSMEGKDKTYDRMAQIRGEQAGAAKDSKAHSVIIVSDDPAYKPSGPLATSSTLARYDSKTGGFSLWNPDARNKKGGWETVTDQELLKTYRRAREEQHP